GLRGGEAGGRFRGRAERLRPQQLAALDVVGLEARAVLHLVDAAAVDDGRGEAELIALLRPLRRLDLAGLRAVDRRDHAQLGDVEVLVAVRDDDGIARDDRAGVDRALGDDRAPHLLAGLRLHRVDAAVAAAADQKTQPVDRANERRRVIGVVGAPARTGDPDDVAAALVERHEPVLPRRARAPARDRGGDDDQIAVDDRRRGAAAVRGERGELFADRAIPEQLAVLVQRD